MLSGSPAAAPGSVETGRERAYTTNAHRGAIGWSKQRTTKPDSVGYALVLILLLARDGDAIGAAIGTRRHV